MIPYPIYTVPKGCHLYRKAKTTYYYPNMFFGFSPIACNTASYNKNEIQIWETIEEIECPLLIKGINGHGLALTALVDVYNSLWVNDKVDDWQCVDIKRKNWPRRRELLDHLRTNGIKRWVAPLEDFSHTMELFLFASKKEHQQLVKFVNHLKKSEAIQLPEPDSFNYEYIKSLNLKMAQFHSNPDDPLIQAAMTDPNYNLLL